jgi:alpha-1,2-mannosyltransferase
MDVEAATQRLIGDRGRAWLWVLLAGAAIQTVLWSISEPGTLFGDFYKAYYPTAERLWREGPHPTWQLDEASELGFVNIPVVAWLFVPLVPLGAEAAAWTFLALGMAATAGAWGLLIRLARPEAKIGPGLLLIFLVNGPLVYSFREGNITHFILLFLAAALLLWNARSEYAAGLLLGLCAVLKLPLLLYGAYFVLRRRWRIVAGAATTIGLAIVLSFALFGLEINIDWYRYCVEPFLGQVVPAFNVQSIDGFLIRLKTGGDYLLYWEPVETPIVHKIGRTILFVAMLGGAYWLVQRAHSGQPVPAEQGALSSRDLSEYALVLNLALVMSPVSWTHYYLLLLLPWALYLGGRLHLPDDAASRWLMGGGIVLSSLPVVILPVAPGWVDDLVSRTVVSAWLFGGLCPLAALARGLWRTAP